MNSTVTAPEVSKRVRPSELDPASEADPGPHETWNAPGGRPELPPVDEATAVPEDQLLRSATLSRLAGNIATRSETLPDVDTGSTETQSASEPAPVDESTAVREQLILRRATLSRLAGSIASVAKASPDVDTGSTETQPAPEALGIAGPIFRPWEPTESYPTWYLDELSTMPDARFIVNDLAREILEVEQPIHRTRLAKLIANACGMQRVRQSRVDSILAALGRSTVRFDRAGFAWDASRPADAPVPYRPRVLKVLSIDEVHPAEIYAAVAEAHRRNGFAERETVVRAALSALGGKSLTSTVRPALEKAYRQVTPG
ncbi:MULTISPECIES: DUF3320 domain-containing protein [Brachybacterium]|uniref:DUF3320 domain-containing protein n=1 Tax=Brachybacterium TaxID=43668 RepID=UPI000F8ED195|nr:MULTISPECIES: DUF3320 domain-containing protein [Brachybacterium]